MCPPSLCDNVFGYALQAADALGEIVTQAFYFTTEKMQFYQFICKEL